MAECFGVAPARTAEWDRGHDAESWLERGQRSRFKTLLAGLWQEPDAAVEERCRPTTQEIEACFKKLADEWERETQAVSSVPALISHPNYQRIIKLGWGVVPFLLHDLQMNRRFWFPALYEITRIRPFDRSDAGDSERMLQAWVKWGKRKQLI